MHVSAAPTTLAAVSHHLSQTLLATALFTLRCATEPYMQARCAFHWLAQSYEYFDGEYSHMTLCNGPLSCSSYGGQLTSTRLSNLLS